MTVTTVVDLKEKFNNQVMKLPDKATVEYDLLSRKITITFPYSKNDEIYKDLKFQELINNINKAGLKCLQHHTKIQEEKDDDNDFVVLSTKFVIICDDSQGLLSPPPESLIPQDVLEQIENLKLENTNLVNLNNLSKTLEDYSNTDLYKRNEQFQKFINNAWRKAFLKIREINYDALFQSIYSNYKYFSKTSQEIMKYLDESNEGYTREIDEKFQQLKETSTKIKQDLEDIPKEQFFENLKKAIQETLQEVQNFIKDYEAKLCDLIFTHANESNEPKEIKSAIERLETILKNSPKASNLLSKALNTGDTSSMGEVNPAYFAEEELKTKISKLQQRIKLIEDKIAIQDPK